jgi:hypothetical protein
MHANTRVRCDTMITIEHSGVRALEQRIRVRVRCVARPVSTESEEVVSRASQTRSANRHNMASEHLFHGLFCSVSCTRTPTIDCVRGTKTVYVHRSASTDSHLIVHAFLSRYECACRAVVCDDASAHHAVACCVDRRR